MSQLKIALGQQKYPWLNIDTKQVGLLGTVPTPGGQDGYGLLYNGYTIQNANFPPTGWSIPTDTQFSTLMTGLGGSDYAGGHMKSTGYTYWLSPNTGADDSSNFSGRGSGYRKDDGTFTIFKYQSLIALYPYFGINNSCAVSLATNNEKLLFYVVGPGNISLCPLHGLSVRFIYTGGGTPASTVTDYDSNVYDVIQIGTQYWTKQNWKCTHLNNGTTLTKVVSDSTWTAATTGNYYYCAPDNNDLYI